MYVTDVYRIGKHRRVTLVVSRIAIEKYRDRLILIFMSFYFRPQTTSFHTSFLDRELATDFASGRCQRPFAEAALSDYAGMERSKRECRLWLSRLKNICYPLNHFAEKSCGKKGNDPQIYDKRAYPSYNTR